MAPRFFAFWNDGIFYLGPENLKMHIHFVEVMINSFGPVEVPMGGLLCGYYLGIRKL